MECGIIMEDLLPSAKYSSYIVVGTYEVTMVWEYQARSKVRYRSRQIFRCRVIL